MISESAMMAGAGAREPVLEQPARVLWNPAVQERLPAAMAESLRLAKQAMRPFGSVIIEVTTGDILLRGHNTRDSGDPTAHAEVNVLRAAGMGGIRLADCILVTTAEPCPMCTGALIFGRVAGVVYGTSIATLISLGYPQINIASTEIAARSSMPTLPIVGGFLERQCTAMYQSWARPEQVS